MVLLLMGYLSSGWLARRLRRPVQMKSVAEIERRAFFGTLPTVELQRRLYAKQRVRLVERATHGRVPVALRRAVRVRGVAAPPRPGTLATSEDEFAVVSAVGLVMYVVVPSAPPWMASAGRA